MAYYTSNNKIGSFEIACEREHCSKISGHINIKALFVHLPWRYVPFQTFVYS